MGHGLAVPFVMLFIAWGSATVGGLSRPNPAGGGSRFSRAGAGLQFLATFGAGLFAGSVAFLISATGLVVCFGGFAFLRAWTFPPTLTMQLLASRIAAGMLTANASRHKPA